MHVSYPNSDTDNSLLLHFGLKIYKLTRNSGYIGRGLDNITDFHASRSDDVSAEDDQFLLHFFMSFGSLGHSGITTMLFK